jgi:uncharacterized OB-fold protein
MSERPLPDSSPRMAPFWSAAREGRLVLQRCGKCGHFHFPPVEICSGCLSSESLSWVDASGRGEVFSYVVMHQIYHPAFVADAPYTIVDVKLAEGPRMIARVIDCAPAEVRIGMPLDVSFERASEEFYLPVFRSRAV